MRTAQINSSLLRATRNPAKVAARHKFSDSNGIIEDSSNRISAAYDLNMGLQLGGELMTNGDFSNGLTDWTTGSGTPTLNVVSGVLNYTTGVASNEIIKRTLTLVQGKVYKISIYTSPLYGTTFALYAGGFVTLAHSTFNGVREAMYIATSSSIQIALYSGSSNNSGSIDNISVKEVLGNHIVQTTTANRLIHSNRYNYSNYSNTFDNAAWYKDKVVLGSFGQDPFGGNTARKIAYITDGSRKSFYNGNSLSVISGVGVVCTTSIYAKAAEYSKLYISDVANGKFKALFNLATNEITLTGGADYVSAIITNEANGFKRCIVTYKNSGTTPTISIVGCPDSGVVYDGFSPTFTGDAESGVIIFGYQANLGAKALPYQWINDSTSYNTVGFPYYAQSDGVTQYLKSLAYTLNQPTTVIILCRQVSYTLSDTIFDGFVANGLMLKQQGGAGGILQYSGVELQNTTKTNIGTLDVITACYNNPNSFTKINTLAKVTGITGINNAGGFTLGANGNNGNNSNLQIYDVVIYKEALSDAMINRVMAYWRGKFKDFIDW